MPNKKNISNKKTGFAVGAGVAALAAAAAATYFLTGKHAGNRKKLAKWAKDMKTDVAKEFTKAGKMTQAGFHKAVDQVAKNYKAAKKVSAPELSELANELKSHWVTISKEINSATQSIQRVVPKAARAVKKKVKVNIQKPTAKKGTKSSKVSTTKKSRK